MFSITPMETYTRETGSRTKNKEREPLLMLKVINTKATSKMTKSMEKECFHFEMEISTMEIG